MQSSVTFTATGKSLTESDLKALEYRLGFSLPDEYRQFLLTNNGGIPGSRTFNFENLLFRRQETNMIERFHRVGADKELDDLEKDYFSLKEDIAPGFLPIASLMDGSRILIGVLGDDRGAIHYWDYGQLVEPNAGEELGRYNVYPLAESLNKFLDSLYDDPI